MGVHLKRRTFLKVAGVSAVAAGVALNSGPGIKAASIVPTLDTPISYTERNRTWHFLNRAAFGPFPGQIEDVKKAGGITAYYEQQMRPMQIDDSDCDQRLKQFPSINMTVAQIRNADEIKDYQVAEQLGFATLTRSIYSKRQLLEVMTLFWSEHFSILQTKGWNQYLQTVDDRDVIRKNALGTFRNLLFASAKSPAMLEYLDNAYSDKSHANENYAREIMELHTLGVGNYTEKDIKELARCLTGWSWDNSNDRTNPHFGEFVFKPYMHDDGQKVVLGRTIPAGGGMKDVETVLDILAVHPATAKFISTKLCRRFIGDTPSAAVVKRVSDVFLKTKGDIPSLLRSIFSSAEFWSAPPKFKRPYEYIVGLIRALDYNVDKQLWEILHDLEIMNHRPFYKPTPDGYKDVASAWNTGSMMDRWNFAIEFTQKKGGANWQDQSATTEDAFKLAARFKVPNTPQGVLNFYAQLMLGRPLQKGENDTIWKFVNGQGKADLTNNRAPLIEALSLIATSPAYQYR